MICITPTAPVDDTIAVVEAALLVADRLGQRRRHALARRDRPDLGRAHRLRRWAVRRCARRRGRHHLGGGAARRSSAIALAPCRVVPEISRPDGSRPLAGGQRVDAHAQARRDRAQRVAALDHVATAAARHATAPRRWSPRRRRRAGWCRRCSRPDGSRPLAAASESTLTPSRDGDRAQRVAAAAPRSRRRRSRRPATEAVRRRAAGRRRDGRLPGRGALGRDRQRVSRR